MTDVSDVGDPGDLGHEGSKGGEDSKDSEDPPVGRWPEPGAGPGLREPLPRLLEQVLRGLVRACAAAPPPLPPVRERLRRPVVSGVVVHVGVPGSSPRTWVPGRDDLDLALRTEMIEAMGRDDLDAGRVPLVWITRPERGHDGEDLPWASAAGAAGGELGVRLDLVVVTPRSWHDPRSGVGRRWKRLRPDGR